MKFFLTFIFVIHLAQFSQAEMKTSNMPNQHGSARIRWKDRNVEQKTMVLESERGNAEYFLENLDKKCSELKNVTEDIKLRFMTSFTIPPKTFGPNDVCFPSSPRALIEVYRTLGDHKKEFEQIKKLHEMPGGGDTYIMQEWLQALLEAGQYRAAEKFAVEFATTNYPSLKPDEVTERLKNGQKLPDYLSVTALEDSWETVLAVRGVPDDPRKIDRIDDEIKEPERRMHRYFYSTDAKKRAAALDFYRDKKVKFMLDKARKMWKGEMGEKAEKYFEDVQKSTSSQKL